MRYRLDDFVLDFDLFELRRGDDRVQVQPKVLLFLRLLAENAHRTVPKDEILDALWPDVVVAEASLQRLASLARRALAGPDGRELIRNVRGVGYGLAGPLEPIDEPGAALRAETGQHAPGANDEPARARPEPAPRAADAPVSEQEIRFCKTVDGVNVAWARAGHGPPLVRSLGWFTNLELEWSRPAGRRFWEMLAGRYTLIRYDGRGIGLSDPAEEFSLETRLRDLEAVVDAAASGPVAIMAISEGCSAAVRYAARHPDRVSHLVLCGVPETALGPLAEHRRSWASAVVGIIDQAWGNSSPVWGRFMANLFLGLDASEEMIEYFDLMQRASAQHADAMRYYGSLGDLDVTEDLPNVRAPTLVVHQRGDHVTPFESARRIAARIANATLCPLPGENHWMLLDESGGVRFVEILDDFLAST